MGGLVVKVLLTVLRRSLEAGCTCIFAVGGAIVGTITGAMTGHTTETGFFRGAGIGAVAGAVVAIELFESLINGDSLTKIDIFGSLLNGKIFREWVSPAMLKAYQWQVGGLETSYGEISDIYDIEGPKGLSHSVIKKLPEFHINKTVDFNGEKISCTICLQDFKEGDEARRMLNCRHFFHLACIDEWLVRQGTCPICREDV
ncbi:hypothetical protein Sjap_003197 [Stephania japonica]|uniref:RING-type domain-containing protein n=1 Tax=Stephania japonica TaxID=461633 RepID=A0AAP0KQE7_9MAGN